VPVCARLRLLWPIAAAWSGAVCLPYRVSSAGGAQGPDSCEFGLHDTAIAASQRHTDAVVAQW
jgi:hypothetical protein